MKITRFERLGQQAFLEMARTPADARKVFVFGVGGKWYLAIRRRRELNLLAGGLGHLRAFASMSAVVNLMDMAGVTEYVVNSSHRDSICPFPRTLVRDCDAWVVDRLKELVPNSQYQSRPPEIDLVSISKQFQQRESQLGHALVPQTA